MKTLITFIRVLVCLFVSTLLFSNFPVEAAERVNPLTDFEYLGAFRLPNESSGGTSWSYGGLGMTYYPNGDPGDTGDGYPGSLFGVGHSDQNFVSEFSIPAPAISTNKNLSGLPRAITLQPFTDVTDGVMDEDERVLRDIQYYSKQGDQTTDKLYWGMYDYYVPDKPKLYGWCELDFGNLQSQGTWQLNIPSLTNSAAQTRYMFDISQEWADLYVSGKYLAAGRKRPGQGQGSFGPALYAYAPWDHGNPPPDGAYLDTVQLLYYPDGDHRSDEEHSWGDQWNDGAWLTVGAKQAVIFAGRRSLRTFQNGLEYYGPPLPGHLGGKGFHSDPYYCAIIFYDTDELAEVAQGTRESYEVHPYAVFNVVQYLFPRDCDGRVDRLWELGGVGYDRDNQLLYVMQRGAEFYYGRQPIVHVWKVADNEGDYDTTLPQDPKDLRVVDKGSDYVELAWSAAYDNTGVSGYVVYRNFVFIAVTDKLSYTDTIISPDTTYKYTIAAFDCMNNYGPQCIPVEVTTDSATDTVVPNLDKAAISNVAPNSVTLSWKTDEPSITKIEYAIIYSGDEPEVIEDPALKLNHSVTLIELEANSWYGYSLTAEDAYGNTYEWADSLGKFHTAEMPPVGNKKPTLDNIGPQEIYEGDKLELNITGFDEDGDRIFFSMTEGPEGAICHPMGEWFGWTPRFDQAGEYEVTFTVTDGTDSDSEVVTITVLDKDPGRIPGDVDGDGDVDINDLYAVASAFGAVDGDAGYNPACDFDGDGDVDINDLYTCSSNFGVGA